METNLLKRFYNTSSVAKTDDGFTVHLDGRPVKTPSRNQLMLSEERFAQRIAVEFEAQKEHINPQSMPFYRLVNTAIDGVAQDPQAVREDVIRFSGTDLLCYRADAPEGLVAKQQQHWDAPLDWIAGVIGQPFVLGEGIIHTPQPKAVTVGISVIVGSYLAPLEIASLHTMTSLTGSAVLALAVSKAQLSAEEAWTAAHVDEDWNIAQWGEDAEAEARRAQRWLEMDAAAFVFAAPQ